MLPHWADRPLGSIRPSDVDDWVAELSRKMGPYSVQHCYTLFRGPLRRTVKDQLMEDPCIDVPLPRKPDLRKTFDDVLSAHEVDRLVDAMADRSPGYASLKTNDRYEALVLMGAWLGPRWMHRTSRGGAAEALLDSDPPSSSMTRVGGLNQGVNIYPA